MKIIPDVKCRRCGESFSSLRNRCPNCNTRRVSQSTRTPAPTPSTVDGTPAYTRNESNAKWQMIFGGILVVAVVLAVVVMVSTSLNGSSSAIIKTAPTPTPSHEVVAATPVVEAPPTPSPTPMPTVEKLNITYYGNAKEDITMHVGDEALPLAASWTPADITGTARWKSEDSTIVKINVDPEDGNKCTIECLASNATPIKISCTLYGTTTECVIRCIG